MFTGFRIAVADTTQRKSAYPGLGIDQPDGLVAGQALGLEDSVALHDRVHRVSALSGYEEHSVGMMNQGPFFFFFSNDFSRFHRIKTSGLSGLFYASLRKR